VIANGTPFDRLFADLSDRMGVLHTTDTDPSQRDRVIWEHAGFAREPIGYTIPGTVTIGRHAHKYKVSVYGASELEAAARAAQLEGHLDNIIGPPQGAPPPPGLESGWSRHGYKVGESTPIAGGDGTAAGRGCSLTVTLYQPIFSELRASLTVGEVDLTAIASAGQGASADGTMEAALVAG
jgi:hypothetical protein